MYGELIFNKGANGAETTETHAARTTVTLHTSPVETDPRPNRRA